MSEQACTQWQNAIKEFAKELSEDRDVFIPFVPPQDFATIGEANTFFSKLCEELNEDTRFVGFFVTMCGKRTPGEHHSLLKVMVCLSAEEAEPDDVNESGKVYSTKRLFGPAIAVPDDTPIDLQKGETVYDKFPATSNTMSLEEELDAVNASHDDEEAAHAETLRILESRDAEIARLRARNELTLPNLIDEALQGMLGGDQKTIALAGLALIEKLLQKNIDYGSSALASPLLLPGMDAGVAIRVRMSDEIRRIYQLSQDCGRIKQETIDDSLDNLVGYHILSKALVSQKPKVVHGSHGYDIGTSEKLEYGG